MNNFFLWLIMLPAALWKSLGADTEQLRAILQVKLMMDDRKPLSLGTSQAQKKTGKWSSLLKMVIFGAIGFVFAFPLMIIGRDMLLAFTIYYTFFLFFLWFTLVVSFSSVLVDARDNMILLPRPVNERTLTLAKLLHIVIYLFQLVVPMAIPGWVAACYAKGWSAGLIFPLPLILLVLLCLFLVNALYLLIIRLAGPSRFKDVLNYFQIAFSILLFGSYYLLPRMMDASMIQELDVTRLPGVFWVPSYWLAGIWSWFYVPQQSLPGTKWVSLLSFVMPLLALVVTIRFLAPKFMSALAGGMEGVGPVKKSRVKNKGGKRLYRQLSSLLNRNTEAQAGFELTWLQTARSRAFKMKVYPGMAYVPIYFCFLFFRPDKVLDAHSIVEQLSSKASLVLLYICSFPLLLACLHLIYSEQYKASWVYLPQPVVQPGNIMTGAFKAVYVKYFFPFALLVSVVILYFRGWESIFDILLAQMNIVIFMFLNVRLGIKALPFSLKEQIKEAGGKNLARMLLMYIVVGILGFVHLMTVKFWMLKIVVLPVTAALLWSLWDSYKKISWEMLRQSSDEV